ncbi:MAG: tellurite resistance protein [Rhodospirillaceae bacterium]|nr:tellurite resistance protein [Rhodospirillaceae bacterium]|tara:strand:- start:1012 stop:1305 length:294 start_codon:yes stop_codon:yes gene_type:complete
MANRTVQREVLPVHVRPYKSTPVFDQESVPAGLLQDHRTKPGVWGQIVVVEGTLELTMVSPPATVMLDANTPGVVCPGQTHSVRPCGAVRFYVRFYR